MSDIEQELTELPEESPPDLGIVVGEEVETQETVS